MPTSASIGSNPVNTDDPLPTRASLLQGIKDADDSARWNEFHQTYRSLIVGVARRSGLNDQEAEEALQDVLLGVAEKIPDFQYDPAKDSFKGWLLQITRWKIADQFRKRAGHGKQGAPFGDDVTQVTAGGSLGRDVAHPVDPSAAFDRIWDAEWQHFRLRGALDRIKRQVNPSHYAIYHLHVIEEKPVREVCSILGINRARIYLAKHRVRFALRKELARTQTV
jgi:RNA polymerase sigma factor (sigma-70 family)